MAHEKQATIEYGREREIGFWALDPADPLMSLTDPSFFRQMRRAVARGQDVYVADVGLEEWLVGLLPLGPEEARRRMPRLAFVRATAPSVKRTLQERAIAWWSARVREHPEDADARYKLAELFNLAGDTGTAAALFRELARERPDEIANWAALGAASSEGEDLGEAIASMERAMGLARAERLDAIVHDIESMLEAMRADQRRRDAGRSQR
jgi:hypothetical protein